MHKRCHRNVITSCGDKGRAQSLIVKADEVCKLFTLLYNKTICFSCLREHSVLASMYHIDLRFTIIRHQHFVTIADPCFGEL